VGFNDLTVTTKLNLLLLMCLLALVVLQSIQLFNQRNGLLAERKSQLVNQLENVHSLVTYFHEQRLVLGEENAKAQATAMIRKLRYDDGKGYFWINDFDHVMVLHPVSPDLEGKNLSNAKDANGLLLFREFVRIVKTSQQGFFEYFWAVPGKEEPVPKVSFVRGFEPWGWIIGTGVYVDDIDDVFTDSAVRVVWLTLGVLAVVFILARLVTRSIILPLREIVQAMNRAAHGDLAGSLKNTFRRDELGELQRSYTGMQAEIRTLIGNSRDSTDRLVEAIGTLSEVSTQTSAGMNQQADETNALASAVEELASTIREVAGHASETSARTQEADEQINAGYKMMAGTLSSINKVAEGVNSSSEAMHSLEQKIQQINAVLGVIRNISEQTNLLALNAAIEAARAGESGRGFAVVADEVRSLAKRTQESTEEIKKMTVLLQTESAKAVSSMQHSKEFAESCVTSARETGDCLGAARDIVSSVKDHNVQIAITVEEQGAVANEVSANVTAIKDVAGQTAQATRQLAEKGQELNVLVQRTRSLLEHYST
jgi:methyl-accepting chemotaxis protein